jgi:hypothetical protein
MSSTYNEMHMKTREIVTRETPCAYVPEFKRLKYFYGQMLGAYDFQTEQAYFREKLKLHNRCLHGYGVVCGLKVVPEPVEAPCGAGPKSDRAKLEARLKELRAELLKAQESRNKEAAQALNAEIEEICECLRQFPEEPCPEETPVRVHIECGLALDCEGNELVVRQPLTIDLWRWLSPEDRKQVNPDGQTLYVSLCYCEQPVDPVRPVLPDACGATPECLFGKLRDAIRVVVTTKEPTTDERCETCCEPCCEPCLLLAEIHCFQRGQPLKVEQIHNEGRRRIGLYQPTTITGISWTHGATYSQQNANTLIGTEETLPGLSPGLKIQFSRPVLKSTLDRPGIVDLWVLQGGKGQAGDLIHLAGDYIEFGPDTNKDAVEWFRYRQTTLEEVNYGDRVLIIVRTAFILDPCCRPVDGAHVGGLVPILEGYGAYGPLEAPKIPSQCTVPPWGYGPWTSGNGSPGSTFESWFYVEPKPEKPARKGEKT